jgi:hypothetical protein
VLYNIILTTYLYFLIFNLQANVDNVNQGYIYLNRDPLYSLPSVCALRSSF